MGKTQEDIIGICPKCKDKIKLIKIEETHYGSIWAAKCEKCNSAFSIQEEPVDMFEEIILIRGIDDEI